jgi:hypothetical protein
MKLEYHNDKIMNFSTAPLITVPPGSIKNMKLSKGNNLRIEMSVDNNLRITPIFAGPARSEEDECASPNLKLRGDSTELYN